MYKVKSDIDTNYLHQPSKLKRSSNKKLTSKDKIRPDMLMDYTIPPTFEKHIGKDDEDLYLPKGVLRVSKKAVSSFIIGKQVFHYDKTSKMYVSEAGIEYKIPQVKFSENGLNKEHTYSNSTEKDMIKMDVLVDVSNTPAAGLQMIQTFRGYGSQDPRFQRQMKRMDNMGIKENLGGKEVNRDEVVFVDGGLGSPDHLLKEYKVNEELPYYYSDISRLEKVGNYNWNKDQGHINLLDTPTAVTSQMYFSRNLFETSLVAVDWLSTGCDLILGSYEWGYDDSNCKSDSSCSPLPIHTSDKPDVKSPTNIHLSTIGLRYVNYKKEKLLPTIK